MTGESFLVQLFPLGIFAIVQVLQISTRWERRGDTSIPSCMGLHLFIKLGETREEITSFGFSTFYWCCCCCCFGSSRKKCSKECVIALKYAN